MMKISIIILSILITCLAYGQKDSLEKNDCIFHNERIDSINFIQIVNDLETLIYESTVSEINTLLDCLFLIDSTDQRLYCFKDIYLETCWKLNDTNLIKNYYKCIKSDFFIKQAYYNIGTIYYNKFLHSKKNDSSSSFTQSEQKELLDFAEKNMWKSVEAGKKVAYIDIGNIQEWKRKYFANSSPVININTDSIKIAAMIRHYGEGCGHIENINIIINKDSISATYFSDSNFCPYNKENLTNYEKYNGLSKNLNIVTLEKFINLTENHKRHKYIFSGEPFNIAIIENKNVISKTIHIKWPYYLEFRKEVFGF
jgi:hypothetical protein